MTLLTKNIATMKAEAQEHIAADAVIGGQYWKTADNAVGGKGCFIACLTHSSDPRMLEERFGFPVMLTLVVEDIFKGLPVEEQPRFFGDIPAAIDLDGKDLTRVVWAFLEEEMRGLRVLPSVPKNIQAVIDTVISGMERLASGGKWSKQDARAAADAARAADAPWVDRASWAAACAFDHESAACAAFAVRAAAEANPQNARQRQAATILRLIAEAPVVQSEGV